MDTNLMMALQLGQIQAGFLGQTAHELRSPMSHIMSLQQLILADLCEDPAEEREFIAQCYAASQSFMKLLDLMVDISKLDYGTASLNATNFDVVELIPQLEMMLSVKAKNRNLRLHFEASESVAETVIVVDRQRFFQYFLTLLNTTINQTPQGDVYFRYKDVSGDRLAFEIECNSETNFWEKATAKDITISGKPTLEELKQAAEDFEFSPALKWQACQKLMRKFEGEMAKKYSDDGVIQVRGWLPLGNN